MFGFSGGLTQSDWLSGLEGVVGSTTAAASYNQAAYLANVSMRQAQLYQEKNYKLDFLATARDDIREMMAISVNRVNNYMVVATLILGIAAANLQSADFPTSALDFIVYSFWANMCISILHFALSIMFAIKAQNGAFLNTMRLLTWELRPENPANYDFDYSKQAAFFESRGGIRELFRVPGLSAPRIPEEKPQGAEKLLDPPNGKSAAMHGGRWDSDSSGLHKRKANKGTGGTSKMSSPELEEVEPESRELSYLRRYGRYMQLWQPFDTRAKHCIGLGLMSLSQGTGCFALGMLFDPKRPLSGVVAIVMVAIFTAITILVSSAHFKPRRKWVKIGVHLLFFAFPVFCTIAFFLEKPYWAHATFATLCPFSNCGLFVVGLIGAILERRTPSEITAKFTRGPAGQEFTEAVGDMEMQVAAGDSNLETEAALQALSQAKAAITGSLVFCVFAWLSVGIVFIIGFAKGELDVGVSVAA